MPTYDFVCENKKCDCITFESFNHFNDAPLAKCPECMEFSSKRLIGGGLCIINKSPQTLGGLADKNRKAMGSYLYDKKMREKRERAIQASNYVGKTFGNTSTRKRDIDDREYVPPWREGPVDTSLAKMVEIEPGTEFVKITKEGQRYIMEGKKGEGAGNATEINTDS